jgi:hypothetical protein
MAPILLWLNAFNVPGLLQSGHGILLIWVVGRP